MEFPGGYLKEIACACGGISPALGVNSKPTGISKGNHRLNVVLSGTSRGR